MTSRSGSSSNHEASRRIKTELLIQMDGLMSSNEKVFVLAASNLPWDLDNAFLRRLEKRLYVPLPNEKNRLNLLKNFLKKDICSINDFSQFSKATNNYSGSDMHSVCKEANMIRFRKAMKEIDILNINEKDLIKIKIDKIIEEDLKKAIEKVKPSPTSNLDLYLKWFEKYGSS